MPKDSSASDILLMTLPVLLVLLALVGAIVFFPEGSPLDIRSKAAPVVVAPTRVPVPTAIITATPSPIRLPEDVCSDLYKPVCSTANNQTYANECEARLAKALPIRSGICPTPTRTATPAAIPQSN